MKRILAMLGALIFMPMSAAAAASGGAAHTKTVKAHVAAKTVVSKKAIAERRSPGKTRVVKLRAEAVKPMLPDISEADIARGALDDTQPEVYKNRLKHTHVVAQAQSPSGHVPAHGTLASSGKRRIPSSVAGKPKS